MGYLPVRLFCQVVSFPSRGCTLESSYPQYMADTRSHALGASPSPSLGCIPPRSRNPLDQRNMPNESSCPSLLVHTVATQGPGASCLNDFVPASRACAGLFTQSIPVTVEHTPSVPKPCGVGGGGVGGEEAEMRGKRRSAGQAGGLGTKQLAHLRCRVQHGMLQNPRILNLNLSFQITMKICYICWR